MFEKGLYTEIGTNTGKFSGGQKQRVALARMFNTNSEVFLDDPSSALDNKTELKLWDRFFKEEYTAIVVSKIKQNF